MRRHSRSALVELRKIHIDVAPNDAFEALGQDVETSPFPAVASWASRHHLDSPCLIALFADVLGIWTTYPAMARDLAYSTLTYIDMFQPTEAYEALLRDAAAHMPKPNESLREWRRRADLLHRVATKGVRPRRDPWPARSRHAEWFVLYQVCGRSYDEVAATEPQSRGIEDRAIRYGVERVAKTVGITLRRSKSASLKNGVAR